MSIQKRKILENAQKFLQKGQLDRALKEYQIIVQADPRDSGTRLKVGDLHLKRGEKEEAVNAYLRVADQFMKDGFDAKAVALYKQIHKIDATRADVHVPLAELYQRLGLNSEALISLQAAADAFHREGRKREALELLRKMATLDPSNTTSRIKIAELLQQAGMRDEALAELEEISRELERQGDVEGQFRVHERLVEVDHARLPSHLAMARISLDQSRLDDAEGHARRACDIRPDAPEAIECLTDVLRAAGRDDELEPLYRRLAEVHRERGDESKAREILQRFVSTSPLPVDTIDPAPASGAAEATLVETVAEEIEILENNDSEPVVSAEPTAPPVGVAPGTSAETVTPTGDPEQLLAEAKVYLRYQKTERARASLEAAIACAPQHVEVATTLADLLDARGEGERAAAVRAQAGIGVNAERDGANADSVTAPGAPASGEVTSSLEAVSSTAADLSLPDLEVDVEFETGADVPPTSDDDAMDPDGSMSSLAPLPDVEIDLESTEELDQLDVSADESVSDRVDRTVYSASLAVTASKIVEELEEGEFYFQQNLYDEAEAVYERVLVVAPNHPQALLRLGEIAASRGDDPSSTTRSGITATVADVVAEASDAAASASDDSTAEPGTPGFDLEIEIDLANTLGALPSTPAIDPAAQPESTGDDGATPVLAGVEAGGVSSAAQSAPDLSMSFGETGDSALFASSPEIEPVTSDESAADDDSESASISIDVDLEDALDSQASAHDPLGLSITRPDLDGTLSRDSIVDLASDTAPAAADSERSTTLPGIEETGQTTMPPLSDEAFELSLDGEQTLNAAAGISDRSGEEPALSEAETGATEPVLASVGDEATASLASGSSADIALDPEVGLPVTAAGEPGLEAEATQGIDAPLDVADDKLLDVADDKPLDVADDVPLDVADDVGLSGVDSDESSADEDAAGEDTTNSTDAVAPLSDEPEAAFDLAAELADALDSSDDQTSPVAAQVSASDDAFTSVFREFKQGVKRVIGTGDYQTHYDLGIAYREMGLFDDASGEFAEASNAPELRLSSLHLLALCALDSKRACDAVAHLGQALSLPELPDEQLPALRFDLARAHAAMGDVAAALSLLDSVAQSDAGFPGLSDLRATLVTQPASARASEDEEPLERFDDLIADADRAVSSDDESAARVATTGAETPAPPAQPPADGGGKTPRRRKFSFL